MKHPSFRLLSCTIALALSVGCGGGADDGNDGTSGSQESGNSTASSGPKLTPEEAQASFERGQKFDEKGGAANRRKALAAYREAAESGHAEAMHMYGAALAAGYSGEPDYVKAAEWYRRSAEHGRPDALNTLALLYDRAQEHDKALELMRQAAAQGSDRALLSISLKYRRGQGVEKDLVEALAWCSVAQGRQFDMAGFADHYVKTISEELSEADRRQAAQRAQQIAEMLEKQRASNSKG